jgi:capsule polysaccharide modification protein KpsS
MNELCTVVCDAVNKFSKKNSRDLQVAFKLHPADAHLELNEIYKTIKANKAAVFISKGDTKELIKSSQLVITINSTVGIEALMEIKPVVTLGHAFYNIDGIASHCDDFDKLDEVINNAINEGADKNLIEKFLYYLRFDYFKEIHWRNPDKKSLKRLASDIL